VSVEPLHYKIKSAQFSNGLTRVKILIKNDMLTKQQAINKKVPQSFLTNIRLLEGNEVVYNAKLTPYISKNPIFQFMYYGSGSSALSLETIDNNKQLFKGSGIIRQRNETRDLTPIKKKKESNHSAKVSAPAIQEQFGNIDLIMSENIKIVAPDVASNSAAVPVKIQSNIKAKSVALFATESDYQPTYWDFKYGNIPASDDDDLVLVYQYLAQKRSIIDFDIKIKFSYGKNSKVLVIIEAEDGKFYMAEKPITIGICLDSGG
jgi:predicted secreted protein